MTFVCQIDGHQVQFAYRQFRVYDPIKKPHSGIGHDRLGTGVIPDVCRTVSGLGHCASVKVLHRLAKVNALVHVLAVVLYRKHHAITYQRMLHQSHGYRVHHFADHKAGLVKGVWVLQNLALPRATGAGFGLLDVSNGTRFVTPGVVYQNFGIHAEKLVQAFGVLDTHPGDVPHGENSAATVQIALFQTLRNPAAHLPKTGNGAMRPELPTVTHLVQFRNANAVGIGFHMLGHHVHGDLAEIQVCADAACSRNPCRGEHVLNNGLHQFPRRLLIQLQVFRQVQEAFINRIGVDIFGADVLQVYIVDLRGILHVLGHLGFCNQEFHLLAGAPFHLADLLVHLEKPRPPGNPVGFQRRRHRKANGLFGAALVGHHKFCF